MAKKKGGAALTAFTVTVTPKVTTGFDVECDLSDAPVGLLTDNALFLDLETPYDITFKLVSGPGGNYSFYQSKPFCNQAKRCPPQLPGGSAHAPCSVTDDGGSNGGASITVHIDRIQSRTVTNYRLNFDGGFSCDPIIINS